MNNTVTYNFSKVKLTYLFLPLMLLLAGVLFLLLSGGINTESYIGVQRDLFYYLNSKLGQFPVIEDNLTQLGDALILFPFLGLFIVSAPKIWENLFSASIISLILSSGLKKLFSVPRPAAFFDPETFNIVGKTLTGHNSTPSGHSITVFTTLMILMFAFMPKNKISKNLWVVFVLIIGLILISSRVGVGAHYPLDTLFGAVIGFSSAVLGVLINRNVNIWKWIENKKYYGLLNVIFTIMGGLIVKKILKVDLFVFYLSLFFVVISILNIIRAYVKK